MARDTDAGHARYAEYRTSGTVSHLNDAVQNFQLVLDRCPDHAAALTNLAWARLEGYIQNDVQDIDTTTSLLRGALALRPQGHLDHALSLYNLIFALTWRYSMEPAPVYIHESVELCCKLLPLCPEGTYLPLYNLSWVLSVRFEQHGSIDDIDESIQLGREAVSLCPEGQSGRDTYLNNLAYSLQFRFYHQGQYDDLDEAIFWHESVLCLRSVGHEARDSSLDILGSALCARFRAHSDIDDINRAVSLLREALKLRPPGHPRRYTRLHNLAITLHDRYGELHVIEDLNEAIDLHRESLRITPLDHPERHKNHRNLSSALCSRFTQTEKNEDIEEAIQLCQKSLEALPPLHPERQGCYFTLRDAYMSRYRVQYKPADLSLAVEHFRLASRHPTCGFPSRIFEAYKWTFAAEEHGDASALEAYATFFELLDAHLATRSSTTSRREAAAAFHFARSLPVDAASCAIRHDNLRHAVELVEQGRGQQWSLASRLKTPVEDLESGHPDLAHKFSELSKRVSNAAQDSATIADRAAAEVAETMYRKITAEWEAVVAEIRNLQDFSRFLLPPSYEDLQAAARHGPVVILIASQYSCSAIIVPTLGEPCHVPLPSITLVDLEDLKDRFARAIPQASKMGLNRPRNDLIVLLREVWDNIMLPIVNVLENTFRLKRQSRIWLCPTATFTSIPLHAAHPFRTKADRSGKELCLEDLYICSYTPTLSALIRSRQMMKNCVPPSFALLAVDSELELVHKLVPATANRSTLSGDAATRAGALEALEQNTWVHLACHGKQDQDQPYNSHFVMKDEHLTLLDIMEKDIPHAEFAFLSACHTAVGDKETPDEVIHLAAGLQFSGFKSVIGTLWEVDDAVAKHVVQAFYENMVKDVEDGGFMDCTKAAWALNRATHAVKSKVPLEQRMVFVHIGV
ncbi:CHAT domain-containing protein [Suillus clintonianus]|uniref:CHAT domain-containing protein n=1 Tax=Suillus clintonianus TaxID=1904413 RepID=UPI001B87EFB0|nr:CHAT domain-containing protein [Suillus clintonianus]KAG2134486.1 CHAT domain-containing protein [Suillus clintonianus]